MGSEEVTVFLEDEFAHGCSEYWMSEGFRLHHRILAQCQPMHTRNHQAYCPGVAWKDVVLVELPSVYALQVPGLVWRKVEICINDAIHNSLDARAEL